MGPGPGVCAREGPPGDSVAPGGGGCGHRLSTRPQLPPALAPHTWTGRPPRVSRVTGSSAARDAGPALRALGTGWAQVYTRSWWACGLSDRPTSLCPAFLALACGPKFLPCWRQDILWAQVHSSGIHTPLACPSLSRGPRGLARDPAAHRADGFEAVTQEGEAAGPQAVNPKPRGPAGTPPSGPPVRGKGLPLGS